MISKFILEAINAIDPNTCADVTGDDTDTIRFFQNPSDITVEQVIDKIPEIESEHAAQAYIQNRRNDYPSSGDQWDMIYKDNKNGTTTHADAVEAVKTKWPKDNSGPK